MISSPVYILRPQLPDRASFHSPAAFCASYPHEQIHSTGHESRLKRDLAGSFGKARSGREELVAELGEVLLGNRLEIGPRYLEPCRLSWPLDQDDKEITEGAASIAQRGAAGGGSDLS